MTLKEFIKKYNGKHVDYDGVFGAQCMDLMHFYIDEVLMGEPSPGILRASSAKIAYETFDRPDLFEQIDNTPKGVPEEGDIMFWGIFPYGHVAPFVEGDVNNFTSFDQNYPKGSECHEQNHTYKDVLGWLRFKGEETGSDCEQEITRLEKELDAKADEIIDIRESRDKWKREKRSGGANITLNGTQKIQINGADELDDHGLETEIVDSAGVAVVWNKKYTNTAGKWCRYELSDTFAGVYNNAGTITALGGSKFAITPLYASKDDLNSSYPTFFAVVDTAQYNNLSRANTAIARSQVAAASNELLEL